MAINLKQVQFGRTGMEITRVGFGAWAIGGGDWQFGWGAQRDHESVQAIERALELGVNWIDTAAAYGFGRSEQVVGEALAGISAHERPYVFTKCSMIEGTGRQVVHSLQRDSVLREAEASLNRLGLDAIDLYQIHWPNPVEDIEQGWRALVELREQGMVKHIGVSNFSAAQIAQLAEIAPVETLQPPYSLIRRDAEGELLDYVGEHQIGVIVYSPMESGLLSGSMTRERIERMPQDDWRKRSPRFNEPALTTNLELAARLGEVGARHGTSAGAVAIAWTLRNPAVTAAIVGFRNPEQVDPLLIAADLELDADDIAQIEGRR